MLDKFLKRDKFLLGDKSDEKELGLQRSKKSLNLGRIQINLKLKGGKRN
jgi:hypothetical protein